MARRSRRGQGIPVSLFSFQDIMMSIMGILVLVTLIMALDLSRTASVAEATSETPPVEIVHADIRNLKDRENELRNQYEDAMAKLSGLAGMTGDQRHRIQESLNKLSALQQDVQRLESEITARSEKVNSSAGRQKDKRKTLELIVEMEQRTAQLKAEIDQLRHNPRITYLIQGGYKKTPLLIELSDSRIGIGSPNQRESAIWLDLPDRQARLQLLLGVVGSYDQDKYYVVVLLKPSGFAMYDIIKEEVKKRGFGMGTELIAEEQFVLLDSSAP